VVDWVIEKKELDLCPCHWCAKVFHVKNLERKLIHAALLKPWRVRMIRSSKQG